MDAFGHTAHRAYDSVLGLLLSQTDPNGLTTAWQYDAIGRPVMETRPDATQTRHFYRLVTAQHHGPPPRAVHYHVVQSSGGPPAVAWFDILDREIRADQTGFAGGVIYRHTVFNERGEVVNVSQPYFAGFSALYSIMTYDPVGRLVAQVDPGNRTNRMFYNGLTNLPSTRSHKFPPTS